MSVALVSLERAKAHLNVIDDAQDEEIEAKILEASDAVLGYLDDAADAFLDTSGNVIEVELPARVTAATLAMLGVLFKDRDNSDTASWQNHGYLPPMVVALLYPLRTPTLS
jgi:hypothetical protein